MKCYDGDDYDAAAAAQPSPGAPFTNADYIYS